MADVRNSWDEAGEKLTDLGRKLKVHYDAQHTDSQSSTSREELASAASSLGGAVRDAFDAIGTTARDKAVQEDVKQVGQSVVEALGATLGQVSEEVRRALSERKGDGRSSGQAADEGAPHDDPTITEPPAAADPQPPKVEPWGTP